MDITEQRFFSMFDAVEHNNKFWNITLFVDGSIKVHFGPQGMAGQTKVFPAGHKKSGRSGFEKYIGEKVKKGYRENKVLEAVTTSPKASASVSKTELAKKAVADIGVSQPELSALIKYFAEVNAHNLYEASGGKITYDTSSGAFRTTQGIITIDQIEEARELLDKIDTRVSKGDFSSNNFFDLVNPYLSIIPQKGLVRQLDFTDMFSPSGGLQKQSDMLDALESSYSTVIAAPKKDNGDSKNVETPMFNVTLATVSDGKIIDKVRKFYRDTKGGHRDVSDYDVKKVFTLSIATMFNAFKAKGEKVGNIMQLWHGTKASNMLSILKGGMIIPHSGSNHVTGRMFGDGLYFSDQSTKSIRYATGAWGYGGSTDRKFMLLVDVAMGKYYTPRSSFSGKVPNGYDSCFAQANKSGVMNNEMIVYNTCQANPVYLIEFTPFGR